MSRRNGAKNVAFFSVILILVLAILYSGLRILESTVFYKEQDDTPKTISKTIMRDGIAYFPRQDITTVLFMGIDQTGPVQSSGSYRNPGAADMAAIVIVDEKNENIRMLCLNRDTMVSMPVLGIGGKQAGTTVAQLALAHTYGNGLEDSCLNVKSTVSSFLNGIQIDYYVAANMDAIALLNDAVGGVTVEVTEDFSEVDASIPKGTVILRGQQSLNYVRTRRDIGDQLNLSRMERQKAYLHGFLEAFRKQTSVQENFAFSVYESIAPYLVSDLSINTLNSMLSRYEDYQMVEVTSVDGKNVLGEEYYEFYPDEEALDELILRLFYAPKN